MYIYIYTHIDTKNMDLTVHCICTGGIHICCILHCMYSLCPNSKRSVCALNFTVLEEEDQCLVIKFCLKEQVQVLYKY